MPLSGVIMFAPHEARPRRHAVANAARLRCRASIAVTDAIIRGAAWLTAARNSVPDAAACTLAASEDASGAKTGRNSLLTNARRPGGTARERAISAVDYPTPERIQPVSPAAAYAAGAASFALSPTGGVDVRGTPIAHAAAQRRRSGPAAHAVSAAAAEGAASAACRVANAALTFRLLGLGFSPAA
jgi:hypothetical protein